MKKFLLIVIITAVLLPTFAYAQNDLSTTQLSRIIGELQKQVLELKEKIEKLQTELANTKKELSDTRAGFTDTAKELQETKQALVFEKTLRRGEQGDEVKKLQEYLSQFPDIYPEKLVTGYFGPLTEKAVQRLQEKEEIVAQGDPATTGFGLVGPRTLTKLNELLVSGAGQSGVIPPGLVKAPGIQKKQTNGETPISVPSPTATIETTVTSPSPAPTTTPVTSTVTPDVSETQSSGGGGGGGGGGGSAPTPTQTAEPVSQATTTPAADTTAPVISNIQATNITETGATITWTTDELADSEIVYSSTASFIATFSTTTVDSTLVTSHSMTAQNLSANTIIYYTVSSKDANGNISTSATQTLTTATPPPPTSTLGPWITYLSITPTSGPRGTIITYTVTAEDPDGVTSIVNDFIYPEPITSSPYHPNWNLGGATSGTQTFSEPMDPLHPTLYGVYVLEKIRAIDSLNNVTTYYPDGTVTNGVQTTHNLTIPSIFITQ